MLRSLRFPFHWFVLLVGLAASGCGDEPAETRLVGEGPASLVALAVEAEAPAEDDSLGAVRSTFQVDGGAATWYDALAAPGRDPAMGLVASGRTVLHGWRWWSDADSTVLGPEERIRGVARPDVAVRSYMERDTSGLVEKVMAQIQGDRPSRLSERVTLLDTERDGQAALLIDVADSVGTVGFWPVRSDQREAGQYRVEEVGGVLVFAAAADVPTDTTVTPAGPIWTAIASGEVRSTSVEETAPEGGRDQAFALGEVVVETPGALAVATGATPEAAAGAARAALRDRASRREARSDRLAARLDEVAFQTRDETTNTAFQWAVLTLDALTVRDSARVAMLPGLPGAEPESFPSASLVTGALLDLGQWETTRDMLTATGAVQRFDRRLDLLGRAPDLVRLDGDDVFATADATPLFLAAAGDYVRTTGDRGLVTGAEDFWFKTVFALRGIYEPDGRNGSAMDTLGHVLASGRRGTWLDGDPSRGGIERRGAIAEGQGALYRALRTATAFAEIMGVSQRSSASWYADTAGVLVRQFQDEFVRDGLVVDQLRGDARRPGGLLALALLDGLPPAERGQLARALAERLAYPYGVASLVQSDSTFHPFLEAPGLYTPESARANGAVHTWLTGPLAVLMAETGGAEFAATLVDVQARLLLDAGAVGAIPELVAGHPRAEGEAPDVGGAPVTPWSLAGFVEGAISGLVGASYPDADTLVLAPRLPEAWGETSLRMRLGDGAVRLVIASGADGAEVRAEPEGDLSAAATLVVDAGGRRVAVPLAEAQSDTLVTPREAFTVAVDATSATVDGEEVPSGPAAGPAGVWDGFAFAAPRLQEEYAVMRAVENQRSLSDDQILRDNPRANLSSTQTDPQGDDWGGTSTFVYPEGTEPGVLDATYLEVARDDSTTYLRAEFVDLSEDTVVAFALDTEPGGAPTVGRGANYEFPDGRGYEYVVFAGAGLAVEDASGRVVGQLSSGSVFDTQTASLAFALPSFIVPRLERGDRVTMLVGARGPDGGFLRVARDASAETGGGRVDNQAPHVYDVVVGSVR